MSADHRPKDPVDVAIMFRLHSGGLSILGATECVCGVDHVLRLGLDKAEGLLPAEVIIELLRTVQFEERSESLDDSARFWRTVFEGFGVEL